MEAKSCVSVIPLQRGLPGLAQKDSLQLIPSDSASKGDLIKELIINGIIILMFGLMFLYNVQAQGTIYLSNLDQTPAGSFVVGNNQWQAANFVTGGNVGGYMLDSIQLDMANAIGNPNGFMVMLYSNFQPMPPNYYHPGHSLETLSGSTNPATSGIYIYTPTANFILSPNNSYFIVVTAATGVGQLNTGPYPTDAYDWNYVGANSYNPNGGWSSIGIWVSGNGASWSSDPSQFFQFAINATAVPELSPTWLFLFGSGIFIYARARKHISARTKSN
jgi:hypothetical protein